ncbi:MAG TPA: choice-of-anchor tandem repeat GloVer-containing protein [Bryobacteraceae bacterium]|nr:choice-of-anchor tandem repeat GloVer-containing protein [Bryobacteraceae bacterium]
MSSFAAVFRGTCCVALGVVCQAQTFTTIASFNQLNSGPLSVVIGADGNFYGTSVGTIQTGESIFKVTPAGSLSTLHSFTQFADDPTQLTQGKDGKLYGMSSGGKMCQKTNDAATCGTIFAITTGGSFTSLYQFSGPDGFIASQIIAPGNLVQASDGDLYGVTIGGGANQSCTGGVLDTPGCGTIFKITTAGALTAVHNFDIMDGALPVQLIQGADGNLYGITQYGGTGSCAPNRNSPGGCGTVFKVTPSGTFSTLYSFTGADNEFGPSQIIQAKDGNLYGILPAGGANNCQVLSVATGCGEIFRLTLAGSFSVIYRFAPLANGVSPMPNILIAAADGNLYGSTQAGANGCNFCGTIFELTPAGALTRLYDFAANGNASATAPNSLIQGSDGNLYGTTYDGGAVSQGSLFKLALASANTPSITQVINGASFQPGIPSGAWVTIKGSNLAPKTDNWDNAIVNGTLPTVLDGVSVMVGTQPAYIAYISQNQINAIAPNVAAGLVPVTVTDGGVTSSQVMANVQSVQPAFFQWGNYAVATRQDFSYAVKNGTFQGTPTVAAKPGDVIILWGTGFGPTSPPAPSGVDVPSTTTYYTAPVSVSVGGVPATVYGTALAPGYAGLYQVAIQVPQLPDGDYPVVATISGAQSPSTTMITVQQ